MHVPSSIRRLAATLLAALFVVVGGAGESLYYLVEAESGLPAGQSEYQENGYFHHHGDGVWHRHGPAPDDSLADAPSKPSDEIAAPDPWLNRVESAPSHLQHSCLLLAFVSQLRQSLVPPPTSIFLVDTRTCFVTTTDCRADGTSLLGPRPRGPPGFSAA